MRCSGLILETAQGKVYLGAYVNLGDIKNSYRRTQMEQSHSRIFTCCSLWFVLRSSGKKGLGLFLGTFCVAFRKLFQFVYFST
jgi:hypothetical protein